MRTEVCEKREKNECCGGATQHILDVGVVVFLPGRSFKKEKRNPALFCLPEKRKKLKFAFAEASS